MRNNYKEVKNFLHNDLGVTKEFVQDLIKESVATEIKKIINEGYFERLIENEIKHLVKLGLSDNGRHYFGFKERVSGKLSDEVGRFVAQQLDIQINLKENID